MHLAFVRSLPSQPRQSILGLSARAIFSRSKARKPKSIEHCKNRRIVHFALVRLMTRRHRGKLHMAHKAQMALKSSHEIAADNLRMIEIELDAHIRRADLGDDVGDVLNTAEEIIGPVTRIDRLEQ